MVAAVADNPAIESAIKKLISLTRDAGAEFAPGLALRVENGDMRMECGTAGEGFIIRLPESCLILPADFRFGLEGDTLMAEPEDNVTPLRAALMKEMVALYNLTGKIAAHKRTLPWYLAAAHPEILTYILRLRDNGVVRRYAETASGGLDDAFTVESFFKTRTLVLRTEAGPVRAVMPVIDFMNHHHGGATFDTISDAKGFGVAVKKAQPAAGSAECFARYGDYDALTAWLHYGFADRHAPAQDLTPEEIVAWAELRTTLENLKLKNTALGEAWDIALRVCGLHLAQAPA
jgi:hypothetical protein